MNLKPVLSYVVYPIWMTEDRRTMRHAIQRSQLLILITTSQNSATKPARAKAEQKKGQRRVVSAIMTHC